jgi:hypothetical protein
VTTRTVLGYALLAAVLGYVCVLLATGADDPEAHLRLLRYWTLGGAAAFAIATPHLLLPDPQVALLQRLNRSPRGLLRHQFGRLLPLVFVLLGAAAALAYVDPGEWTTALGTKTRWLLTHSLIVIGVAAYGFERYGGLGPRSQAWQEGTQGDWYRALRDETGGSFAAPEGLVPALLTTPRVFGVGMLVLVASAALEPVQPALAWGPGALLLGWAGVRLARRLPRYDRAFYATHAFYSEVFRSAGGVRASDRTPIPYDAVYWVPHRWRPPVWASLRQLDRRLPLGRFVALGHGVLWLLFYLDVAPAHVTVFLVLFLVGQNAASGLLATATLAPLPFQLGHQGVTDWIVTRTWVNLRWLLPLALSLGAVALLDPTFTPAEALFWIALDAGLALLTATLFTLAHEARYRRRFA